jgi:hypothetical protein
LFVVNWHIIVRRSSPPNKEKHNPLERKQRTKEEKNQRKGQSTFYKIPVTRASAIVGDENYD